MRNRLLKPLALFIALSFTSGGATAALGVRACAHHVGEAAGDSASGHEAHDHRGLEESSGGGDQHPGGCSCFGQCLGGIAPSALTGAETLRLPSVTNSYPVPRLSNARLFRSQPPFLLPYANAPPAVS